MPPLAIIEDFNVLENVSCGFSPCLWSTPEMVDTSETHENAQGGMSYRSSAAIPNHPNKKPHRRNDEADLGYACTVTLADGDSGK